MFTSQIRENAHFLSLVLVVLRRNDHDLSWLIELTSSCYYSCPFSYHQILITAIPIPVTVEHVLGETPVLLVVCVTLDLPETHVKVSTTMGRTAKRSACGLLFLWTSFSNSSRGNELETVTLLLLFEGPSMRTDLRQMDLIVHV